jgi:AcrR family transcriptional regulator
MAKAVETARRKDLVEATIHEIGASGSLDVTVGQIARRAGVSPALAFHYFGGKDRLFLAAMRTILSVYGAEVRGALMAARDPRTRLEVLVRASFAPSNFRRVQIPICSVEMTLQPPLAVPRRLTVAQDVDRGVTRDHSRLRSRVPDHAAEGMVGDERFELPTSSM